MIGTKQAGKLVTTVELQDMVEQDVLVDIDGEQFEVLGVTFRSNGSALVVLAPVIAGNDWHLEVGKADYDEPMWELV